MINNSLALIKQAFGEIGTSDNRLQSAFLLCPKERRERWRGEYECATAARRVIKRDQFLFYVCLLVCIIGDRKTRGREWVLVWLRVVCPGWLLISAGRGGSSGKEWHVALFFTGLEIAERMAQERRREEKGRRNTLHGLGLCVECNTDEC